MVLTWIIKAAAKSIITTITTKGFFRCLFSFYKKPVRKNRRYIDILKEYLT